LGIRVFPGAQDVLVARVVGMLVQHPAAALHLDGVATAEVGAQVGSVGAALMAAAFEVLILKECNLDRRKRTNTCKLSSHGLLLCLAAIKMTTN